jgi:autotransporter-associated beta strand protein
LIDTNFWINPGALVMTSAMASIGSLTTAVDQVFLNWVDARTVGAITGAIVTAVNNNNNLSFSGDLANTYLGAGGGVGAVYSGNATWTDGKLRLGGGSTMLTYSNVIGGTTNVLIGPAGGNPFSVVLLGGSNTFTAPIAINSGTLYVTNDWNMGSVNNGLLFSNSAALRVGTAMTVWSTNRSLTFGSGGGSINVDTTGVLYITNSIGVTAANAALVKAGGGTLVLTSTNLVGGNGAILSNGILSIGNAYNIGGVGKAMTFSGGVLQVRDTVMTDLNSLTVNWTNFYGGLDINNNGNNLILTNNISGIGLNHKLGLGILTLAGSNNFAGLMNVGAGILVAATNNALGVAGGQGVIVQSGASLWLSNNIVADQVMVTLNGAGFLQSDGALRNVSGINTNTGVIILGSAARIEADGGTRFVQAGNITNAGQALTIAG